MWKQKKKQWSKQNENFAYQYIQILYYIILHLPTITMQRTQSVHKQSQNNKYGNKKTIEKQITFLPSIHIEFILDFITLTSYYNAKNTFRSQAEQ